MLKKLSIFKHVFGSGYEIGSGSVFVPNAESKSEDNEYGSDKLQEAIKVKSTI
jgi:hypothetical protein